MHHSSPLLITWGQGTKLIELVAYRHKHILWRMIAITLGISERTVEAVYWDWGLGKNKMRISFILIN